MRSLLCLTLLSLPSAATAHEARSTVSDAVAMASVIVSMLVLGGIYVAGAARLWRNAGRGRGLPQMRVSSFGAGFALAALLLLSPLDRLADRLLSAHMIQHLGLMLVAAPLMVLGRPGLAALWAFPPSARPALGRLAQGRTGWFWRGATHPLGAWIIYFAVLWMWHMPGLYQAALVNDWVHSLQHMSFLGAAVLFWVAVLDLPRAEGRAGAFMAIFATAIQSCALAALLTTSRGLWYPDYALGAGGWGLSPLEDQQLAGLIMWVPCCALLIGAALAVFAGLLRDAEARAERASP